jgi:PAS domain S-box-containing protein
MDSGIDLLKLVFMAASEGIIISDKTGTIVSANPRAEQMFGFPKQGLEGLTIEDLVPTDTRHKHVSHRESYFHNPNPRPMGIGLDLNGQKKDGAIFPIEISLSHFEREGNHFVAAFVNDITERKRNDEKLKQYASDLQEKVKERTQELEHLNLGLRREVMERRAVEIALRKSQKLYELVAKNFPNGTVSIVDQDFNLQFQEGKGINSDSHSENVFEQNFISRLPEAVRQQAVSNLKKCENGEQSDWQYESGDKTFMVTAVPIAFEKDSPEQILIVEENITDIKKAEKEIMKLLSRERELNEMKSRFVSMASHEFRTPLSTILSSTSLISKYTLTEQQDKRDKHLERIKSSVKNLTEILNDFLSLEKLEAGVIEVFNQSIDVRDFVSHILEELNGIKKTGQTFSFKDENLSQFVSDTKLLKNILINLISNAIKYSPENREIIIALSQSSENLTIVVKDQGMGIPKEEQKDLFQRFFRAKNAFNIQGTGLGLHIVHKYVALMSGDINLESDLDKGTTITITLPNGKEENTHH